MRDLTQKEIDNAPLEYDSYYEDGHGNIRLINTKSFKTCSVKRLPNEAAVITFDKYHYSLKTCKPIPRKQEAFDIDDQWSEGDSFDCFLLNDGKKLILDGEVNKRRATLIAKHFNLTADDLK